MFWGCSSDLKRTPGAVGRPLLQAYAQRLQLARWAARCTYVAIIAPKVALWLRTNLPFPVTEKERNDADSTR